MNKYPHLRLEPYDPIRDARLDEWADDPEVKRFASDDKWSEEVAYYRDDPDGYGYRLGENCFALTAYDGAEIVACLLLIGDERGGTMAFNPIIVAPQKRRLGYCTAVIQKVIENIDIAAGREYNRLEAGIFLDNIHSISAFEGCGFVRATVHPDGDFGSWELILK